MKQLTKAASVLGPRTLLYWGCAGMVMLNSLGSAAWAQALARLPEEDGGTLQWGVAAGLLVLVLLPALIKPKRTHIG